MDPTSEAGLPNRVNGTHHALLFAAREDLERDDRFDFSQSTDLILLDEIVTYLVAEHSTIWFESLHAQVTEEETDRIRTVCTQIGTFEISVNPKHMIRLVAKLDRLETNAIAARLRLS